MTIHRSITLYNSHIDTDIMPNHIEHVEDDILTGFMPALDVLFNPEHISVKFDGIAVFWGTDPATNTFFVSNKSFYNKKKIRIAHSHEEIDQFYDGEMADILHACFKYLPRDQFAHHVFQGDFLGFGHGTKFKQNCIEYTFDEFVDQKVIMAPHTFLYDYKGTDVLSQFVSYPLTQFFSDTSQVKWVQPCVDRPRSVSSAPKIDTSAIKFLREDEVAVCKRIINAFIRQGKPLHDALLTEILGCPHLANLYQLVIECKEVAMDALIVSDAPQATLGGQPIKHEGFVFTDAGGYGFKVVDRERFSAYNFMFGPYQDRS